MEKIIGCASLMIIFLGLINAVLDKIKARKQGKQNKGGSNMKDQEYKGTRNPETDYVNDK